MQGTSCPYRHEPAALGHEQMCSKWKVGQCMDSKCPNRHMVIEKTRGKIQCYWETKPSGCCKPHCVFKHTKRQNNNNNVTSTALDSGDTKTSVPNSVEPTTAAAGKSQLNQMIILVFSHSSNYYIFSQFKDLD